MRSATDFLPWLISTLTNFATSLLAYFGSGRISRLGISLRRGICCLHLRRPVGSSLAQLQLAHSAALGFLAPYFERACLRSLTPAVSRLPRTMW